MMLSFKRGEATDGLEHVGSDQDTTSRRHPESGARVVSQAKRVKQLKKENKSWAKNNLPGSLFTEICH